MFNRLFVRISIIFISVVLVATALPFLTFRTLMALDIIDRPTEEFLTEIDLDEEARLAIEAYMRETRETEFFTDFLQLTFFFSILGLTAGVIASRTLILPLTKLEKAAQAVGNQRFDTRVDIERSSSEIQSVASAFNTMAEKLEREERVRKNLLADVAHELRTPLTVVQGNLRAMLDGVYPLTAEEVANLFQQTELLTRLVDDLHLLSQAEAHQLPLNKEEIQVGHIVQQTAGTFSHIATEQGVQLRPELLGKLPIIKADRMRLSQIMHNLMTNAVRYTPAGGTITIQAEALPDQDRIEIRVIDTGMGIAPDHLPHIFDRFYRADRSRQRLPEHGGTGLGLPITRALVEAHQGEIFVSSEGEGEGSVFTFWLPISE